MCVCVGGIAHTWLTARKRLPRRVAKRQDARQRCLYVIRSAPRRCIVLLGRGRRPQSPGGGRGTGVSTLWSVWRVCSTEGNAQLVPKLRHYASQLGWRRILHDEVLRHSGTAVLAAWPLPALRTCAYIPPERRRMPSLGGFGSVRQPGSRRRPSFGSSAGSLRSPSLTPLGV